MGSRCWEFPSCLDYTQWKVWNWIAPKITVRLLGNEVGASVWSNLLTIAMRKWNGGCKVLKGLAGMAILGGNANPKPEQMSKLVTEARGLQSPQPRRWRWNSSGEFSFLQEFSIKNIYLYLFIWLCWVSVTVLRIFVVACGIFLVVAGRLSVTA